MSNNVICRGQIIILELSQNEAYGILENSFKASGSQSIQMLLCLLMLALAFSLSAFYHILVELSDLSLLLTQFLCAAKVWSVVKFFSKFPGCLTVLQLC